MSGKKRNKTRSSFGATAPPFLDYLRDILRRYPDGGQILKELIQNADDGQATEVVFIHDERSYGTSNLWTENLEKYQGPALYAYNNAAFTDEDWERIQMAGRSGKFNDPTKIGRFGIGFNSVYHITDVPSIFSSKHLGIMDPQEKIFGDRSGGFLWSLEDQEDQDALMIMDDQFQPFRDIVSMIQGKEWVKVITEDHFFHGTIFRFPLRNETSEISDNLYNSKRVVELFDSFIDDAELSLLFLKSVTSVSLIHISSSGTVSSRLEAKASLPSKVTLRSKEGANLESITRFKVISLKSHCYKETQWLVTTCSMKERVVENLDTLAQKLSFLPQVDLAFPCNEQKNPNEGRLSCFLPLPNNESNHTGFPVHVNACFGLTDNRRHIKWEEEDQKHDEHALWNELLIKEVLPHAYMLMIQDAVQLVHGSLLSTSLAYRLWPDVALVEHKHKWCKVALGIFDKLFTLNAAVLSLAKDEKRFIPLSAAVIPCNGPTSPDMVNAIKRTLIYLGENLVNLPPNVVRAIGTCSHTTPKRVTPAYLRQVLRRTRLDSIPRKDKLFLLEFVLSDRKYRELQGLELLPLSDGSFKCFSSREEDTTLIDTQEFPRILLPCCKHLFISTDLSLTCMADLKDLASLNFYKVVVIGASLIAEYTRKFLPRDWSQAKGTLVSWDIHNSQHPPQDWLRHFWEFLNRHFRTLSVFSEIPLIPVSPLSSHQCVSLAKLQQKTTLIFRENNHGILPEPIAQLVTKVGGTVVRGSDWPRHADLDMYVLKPSPKSVLKILLNLDPQHLIKSIESESRKVREELKGYFSNLKSLSELERHFLLSLPLFQTMKGFCVPANTKAAVLLTTHPAVPTELPMPTSYIRCESQADHRLLQLLNITVLGPAEAAVVLVDCIEKNHFCDTETKEIMTWVLQHGNTLFAQNPVLKCKCRDLRFIPVNGKHEKVSSFFDPRVKSFAIIFESHCFPPSGYTKTDEMLESLSGLGLIHKEADVTPEHLFQVTMLIDKLQMISPNDARRSSQVLLGMIDSNCLLSKCSEEQLDQLRAIKWVQCTRPGQKKNMMDELKKTGIYSPNEIRHSMYEDVVGHVMPLETKLSEKVSSKLGLRRPPPPQKVVENLLALISTVKDMNDPETNSDFKRQLHSMYRHMQENCSSFVAVMNKEERWLWAHDHFVSPQELVLQHPLGLDLSCYIPKVPKEFYPYKKFFQELGLRASLTDKEIVNILHSIQKDIETRQPPVAHPTEIKVSSEILCWLWKNKKVVSEDIPVPVAIDDDHFTLKPRSVALLCDMTKDKLKELQFNIEKMFVLHEEIPIATAEWLQIKFLSNYILAPELLGIEQCGQSEPITTRIRNILREYDEPSDIFKEIIQNAEDAGADSCKFMVDFREHKNPPESLIDPNMTLCQGPCLWAFNNKQFTDADWKNIVRVGAASKETQAEKIGKFGLGFNTVYHVTDVPSILSGSKLLIFDPNVTHLNKHIQHKSNPGIKLDLSQERILDCFPGQFASYECIFGCHLCRKSPSKPFPGTLIRLPFRNEEEALSSELSTKVYSKDDIIALQNDFLQNSNMYLLFLKSTNTVSLGSISNNVSTPPSEDEIDTILTVSKTVESSLPVDKATALAQSQAVSDLLEHRIKCKDIIDNYTISIVKMTNHQQFSESEDSFWLLYNCYGISASLQMFLQRGKTTNFSLPIGGIAVPLQTNLDTGKMSPLDTSFVGQAFCFLPLPIHTGLPVNVNGTFAVMSNRKGLWESGEKKSWNDALLRDAVTAAYIAALQALKEMCETEQLDNYSYHTFWPDREKVSESFKPLLDEFYSTVATKSSDGPKLFSDGEQWCSINRAVFLDESIIRDEKLGAIVSQVCREHLKPKCVIPMPMWLRRSLNQSGLHKILQSKTLTWEKFYQEVLFQNLNAIDPKSRDALVLHAIDLDIKVIDQLLVTHPCMPTADGKLQFVKKLINPTGRVACLFGPNEGRLLAGTEKDFCSSKRIHRLLELGMVDDNLPLDEISQKARAMTKVWKVNRKEGFENLKRLLELMKCHMSDKDSPHWETLRNTAFLPAHPPGDIKKQGKVTLYCPSEIFVEDCAPLVNMIHPVLNNVGLGIHSSDPIFDILGIHRSPEPAVVFQQLQQARKRSDLTDTSLLHHIACECYKFLDQWISGCEDTSCFSEKVHSFPFLLIGDTFVNVSCVAQDGLFDAKPYLFVLPPSFKRFRNLWESVGVSKKFTTSHFQSVLHDLHLKYGRKPLSEQDLFVSLSILKRWKAETEEKVTTPVLIPNSDGVLESSQLLFFNDSQWIPVSSGVMLCHADIPRNMAVHFGIQTTKHHTLESITDVSFSPFSFQFEQHEELAVRIRNIITAYPSKKDILKELIQNADDAEATEIHFVWDKREHGKEKTFGENWNHLQGPALCVFNNKVFSDEDLRGIQQLGEGGKRNSSGKTGKFGVGFNSVYHLTDCPAILTGDKFLCISDPNMKYIEGRSSNRRPGIGYNLADPIKEMYEDVYKSFLSDLFPLEEGTMFRLPLRTTSCAENSRISRQEVTQNDMDELCAVLSEDPEGLILFLKNIRRITLHEINRCSGKLQTVFAVEKHLKEACKEHEEDLSKKPVTPGGKNVYETTISTSHKRHSRWVVAEHYGSPDNTGKMDKEKVPHGAIAACVSTKGANATSTNNLFDHLKGGLFYSLPLPGNTGLPVHINGNFELDSGRKNLWKEDGQSEKSNWNEFLKQCIIAPLYADLLHYIKCRVKVNAISLQDINTRFCHSYLCFWPVASKNVGQEWHRMIHEVYKSIKEEGLALIPVLRRSPKKVAGYEIEQYSVDWCDLKETDLTKGPYLMHSTMNKMNPILEDLGMKLVPNNTHSKEIWKTCRDAGIDVHHVSPASVRTFLKAKPLNDPAKTDECLPLPIEHTLMRNKQQCQQLLDFCLEDPSLAKTMGKNPHSIDGLPLLLTRDRYLRFFNSESPKLISAFEDLFSGFEDHFADYGTNTEFKEFLENFNLVKQLTFDHAAELLKPLVQHQLQNCDIDLDSGLYIPDKGVLNWLQSLWRFLSSEIQSSVFGKDKPTQTVNHLMKSFDECCILPVLSPRQKNKSLLQAVKNISSVIKYTTDNNITDVLFKIGFLKANLIFFSGANDNLFRLLGEEFLDANNKSSVMDQVCNIQHSEFSHLCEGEMKILQKFLQDGLSESKDQKEYEKKLKSLPLFESVQGERVRIDGPKAVFVLHSSHVEVILDLLNHAQKNVFLKDNLENVALSQMLKIPVLNDLDLFVRFVLAEVHNLTEKEKLLCLKLLMLTREEFDKSKVKDQIISVMKTVKLIRSSAGQMEMASYFFDEGVKLYKMMVSMERFVPDRFWTDLCGKCENKNRRARDLIRVFGMKHDVSKEDIIKFANQLESETKQNKPLKELKEKSELLLLEAFKKVHSDEKSGQAFLNSIAHIKFVFPVKIPDELSSYHPPFVDEATAVAIRGSLINGNSSHQDLIWSSMPIIRFSNYISKRDQNMIKNIGAHVAPPSQCVADNMRNICLSLCKTERQIRTRARVFRSTYAFLQTHSLNAHALADLPLVLVEDDTRLIKVKDVCLSLLHDLDLRPYLYKIPPQYGVFAEFFRKLGVKDEPEISHYCNVLESVYTDSCGKQLLNPNQMKAVKRAVEQLFKLLKAKGNELLAPDVETLYLPAVDGMVHPSCSLYYNDTTFETKRLEEALENKFLLLEKLSECHLGCDIHEEHRLIQLLPPSFHPKMLTQSTREEVVDTELQQCELLAECEYSGWFRRHLSSPEFRHGLVCLLKDQSEGKVTQQEAFDLCDKTFGSIRIICCKSLTTMLWVDGEPLQRTTRETDVFIIRKQQDCNVYLKHSENMAHKVINAANMALTKEINILLGHRLKSTHLQVLGQLLLCDDLADVQKTLATNGIHDSAETGNGLLSPPEPGSVIPEELHHTLDMNFLNNFEEGEYVGYRVSDNYIYAVIVKEVPGHEGRHWRRYEIDIGQGGGVEVSHLDLYQFKREQVTRSSSMVLVAGAAPRFTQALPTPLPVSLAEAKKEIDRSLNEIWGLPLEQRNKGIRRLYLQWHPDKNPDCISLATEAFKYLQNRIEELSTGRVSANSSPSSRYSNFQHFYQQWNQEAGYHRRGQERFFRSHRSYNSWTHGANVPRPNKEEARRWLKQARCDLEAARRDTDGGSTEWCLFKCHQSVEKALTAAEYRRTGQRPNNNSISVTAEKVSHYHPQLTDLPQIVRELRELGVDDKKTQYPSCHPYPLIPNGQYKLEKALRALEKVSILLDKVQTYIE